jgi:hypothetical protein
MGKSQHKKKVREAAVVARAAQNGIAAKSHPRVLNVPESFISEATSATAASAEHVQADTVPAPSGPIECSIQVTEAGVTVEGTNGTEVIVAKTRLFFERIVVSSKAPDSKVLFTVASPRPKNEIGAAVRARVAASWTRISSRASTWAARTGALVLWLIGASFIASDIGLVGRLLTTVGASSSWEPHFLLVLLAFVMLALSRRGSFRGLLAALYLVFAPVVLTCIITAKIFGGVVLLARLGRAIASWSVSGANWLFAIVCCSAVVKTDHPILLWISVAYLGMASVYIIVSDFYWASSPLRSVFEILGWVNSKADAQIEEFGSQLSAALESASLASDKGRDNQIDKTQKLGDGTGLPNSSKISFAV